MAAIEQSIEVEAPLNTVYNQWTQFEEFPQFMDGVEEVRQLDDTHLHWVAQFGGSRHEWDAEIIEQKPDERVAWRITDGKANAGVVTFHRLDDTRTRVMVQMDFVPDGIKEKIGDALGVPDRRVKGDLTRFKELIEERGTESGAWRGEVKRPDEA
ncbi:MAG TPA: SRPBCC family protein [Thermoleophilaceae bacterium]|nr:SRPBCC family protein [Thermoleophilaceae bacterium]